jgi:hypothetical protein
MSILFSSGGDERRQALEAALSVGPWKKYVKGNPERI